MYLSQSRVSQTIRAMETRVGGRLFERTSRRVRLTPLGERLRDGLRPGFDQIHLALAEAREIASGITGELRVSLLNFAAGGPSFSQVVRAFTTAHPGCEVVVYEAFPGEALPRLRRGELDAVAHWLPIRQPDLVVGPVLMREERALAVRDGHPLAERGYATLEDLGGEHVIDATGMLPPETLEVVYPLPARRRGAEGRMIEVLSLVARGEIVHPTVASLADYYTHPGVRVIPLRGLPPLESALIWSAERETAAVRAFASMVWPDTGSPS
ncbi:LysR family transcriptional regulator [Nonomuraea sediminis]|uniref:LysR family transcriptional regulator n=1 Tax=Nonomuraea sediminis TaxID=2835864 RepID=UPI00202A0BC3|nr:LysR family transcriptional regulator [Nonomuraea sediminis]